MDKPEMDSYIREQVNLAATAAIAKAEERVWQDLNNVLFEIRDHHRSVRSVAVFTITFCVITLLILVFIK